LDGKGTIANTMKVDLDRLGKVQLKPINFPQGYQIQTTFTPIHLGYASPLGMPLEKGAYCPVLNPDKIRPILSCG
jgi:hypothetical protein